MRKLERKKKGEKKRGEEEKKRGEEEKRRGEGEKRRRRKKNRESSARDASPSPDAFPSTKLGNNMTPIKGN